MSTVPPSLSSRRSEPGPEKAAGLKNLQQLIQLRWIAVLGQALTMEAVYYGLDIAIPIRHMMGVLAALALFNLLALLRWRTGRPVTSTELLLGLLVDVAALTTQLYLSGGATNPFVFLYLLQVILGAVLLPAWAIWTMVAVTTTCFAQLAVWAPPLALPLELDRGLASPYMLGLLICFALNAALLVVFITRIVGNLRERDHRLAELRQRASEEEHIVRMGLLASGAAHELGTPLSTLAVILGDWRREPALARDAALAGEIEEMQAQVQRCKSIVSDILLSAGEVRGESSEVVPVADFINGLAEQWRSTSPGGTFEYVNRVDLDSPMVSDAMLRQMVFNVLDNARDASPDWVGLTADCEDGMLRIAVTDRGPGFAPELLRRLGTAYQSSKGQPGGGLGLFLALSVARKLGGHIDARNRPEGGAEVAIFLPLTAVAAK